MRRAFFAVLLAIAPALASAKPAAEFLTLPPGAREAALAGGISLADDAAALAWNPAGLVKSRTPSVTMTHSAYLDKSGFGSIAASFPAGQSVLAIGARQFSAGSLDRLNAVGDPAGTYSPQDLAISVGGALPTAVGGLGGAVKFVQSKIVNSASTWTVDLGYLSPPLFWRSVGLAAKLTNIRGNLDFGAGGNPLPRETTAGGYLRLTERWDCVADLGFPKDGQTYLALGSEIRSARPRTNFALRAGYTTRANDPASAFRFGGGIAWETWRLDYAWMPVGNAGVSHWFTLAYRRRAPK